MFVAFFALIFGIIQVVRSAKEQVEWDNAQTQILDNTKQITGGDSFCRMDIGNINLNNVKGYLVFSVEGKYPLNRVTVIINDLNVLNSETFSISDLYKNTIHLGTLDPGIGVVTQKSIQLDKIKGVNLSLQFSANNGVTLQSFKMRFVSGNSNKSFWKWQRTLFRNWPRFPC